MKLSLSVNDVEPGYRCDGLGDQRAGPSYPASHVRHNSSSLTVHQPHLHMHPMQVDATNEELEIFYFYQTDITGRYTNSFNRSVWNIHILQGARQPHRTVETMAGPTTTALTILTRRCYS